MNTQAHLPDRNLPPQRLAALFVGAAALCTLAVTVVAVYAFEATPHRTAAVAHRQSAQASDDPVAARLSAQSDPHTAVAGDAEPDAMQLQLPPANLPHLANVPPPEPAPREPEPVYAVDDEPALAPAAHPEVVCDLDRDIDGVAERTQQLCDALARLPPSAANADYARDKFAALQHEVNDEVRRLMNGTLDQSDVAQVMAYVQKRLYPMFLRFADQVRRLDVGDE